MSLERTRSSRKGIDRKQGKTIPVKKTSAKKRITAKEVAEWIDKNIEIPVVNYKGEPELKKWEKFKKESGL